MPLDNTLANGCATVAARKVAIIGSAQTTYALAPWDDGSWEFWGLAWRCLDHPRFDRVFEVHNPDQWDYVDETVYGPWLKEARDKSGAAVSVYMLPHVAADYGASSYPLAEVEALMGRRYFSSSFSYMLALAILEGVSEIGIWGVDLVADGEYAHQRPAAEYLLGIAQARGIKVTIPCQSALLKAPFVYGMETPADSDDPLEQRYIEKLANYREKLRVRQDEAKTLEGAIHECEKILECLRAKRRGLWQNP